jgi:YD repeat-containing protein
MDAPIITVQVEQARTRETIRDARGRLIGTLEHQRTGRILARDPRGRLVGTYDGQTTRTANGRLIGRGNLLPALLVGGR